MAFATGLVALFEAAGNPTLQRVSDAADRRMRAARGAGRKPANLVPRISDWRAGRNLPSRFETFHPVLLTLLELVRGTGGSVAADLADVAGWLRLWTAAQGEGAARPAVVNTLRRDLCTFVGRDDEVSRILGSARPGRVVSIHTIDGMPGVGKTALVTRAAHLLAEQFPDGQYFVELHAHTPGQQAADPADVLSTLLIDAGLDPRALPESLAARRNLWRDHLTGKRVLLILDDALDHAQIEALLPAADSCLTLVTSRRRLIALDGATPVTLDILAPAAAVELFSTLALRSATPDTARIVELCGYLPLAISLLAGRIAHHPSWSLAEVAAEFAATRARLDEFEAGDRAVRAAFTTSYARLPTDRQRLFRRLGVHSGPEFDAYAVAALDDTTVAQARRNLEALYVEHLIDETSFGRYRLHDLLRAYAHELIEQEPTDRDAALGRTLDYYERTARLVIDRGRAPSDSGQPAYRPDLVGYDSALAWIRVERANLLACLASAARGGHLSRAVGLTTALVGEVRLHSAWQQAVAMHRRMSVAGNTISTHNAETLALKDLGSAGYLAEDYTTIAGLLADALKSAAPGEHPASIATALRTLARVALLEGDFRAAIGHLEQARDTYRSVDDRHGEAKALKNLGWAHHLVGDYTAAVDALRRSLTLHRALGDRVAEASVLGGLGWVENLADNRAAAMDLMIESIAANRALGQRSEEAFNLSLLAWFHHLDADYIAAGTLLEQVRTMYHELGNRSAEAFALTNLAFLRYLTGERPAALELAQQAGAIYHAIGNPAGEASTLNVLGRTYCGAGEYGLAADRALEALAIYERLGNPIGRADSLGILGQIRHRGGNHDEAGDLLRESHIRYRDIGHRSGETETLNRLAALHAESDVALALATYQDALRLAREIRNPLEEARALEGMARCRIDLEDREAAAADLRAALRLYERIGAAETASATALLESLTTEP